MLLHTRAPAFRIELPTSAQGEEFELSLPVPAPAAETLLIACPEGVSPGETVVVTTASGQEVRRGTWPLFSLFTLRFVLNPLRV